ncbi:MAG: hypothetical protein ACKOXO_09205 [Cyanobium sp.]
MNPVPPASGHRSGPPRRAWPLKRWLPLLLLALLLLTPARSWAGPVSWVEVPPTAEGRQWWDAGSLRLNRAGRLTVLSRFSPTPDSTVSDGSVADSRTDGDRARAAMAPSATGERPGPEAGIGRLYVMELDCEQELYRDISVNGLPRFNAPWQPTGRDDLTAEVLHQACAAFQA